MAKAKGSQIAQFPLSTTQWTPIIAPIDCNYYLIIGNQDGSAMLRCSDDTDASTVYTMQTGGWFSFLSPVFSRNYRFKTGDVVTYVKATSGTGPAIVEFYY